VKLKKKLKNGSPPRGVGQDMSTIVNMLNREACNHGLPKDDFQEKLRGPSYGLRYYGRLLGGQPGRAGSQPLTPNAVQFIATPDPPVPRY